MYTDREKRRSHYREVADYRRRVIARYKRMKGCVDCGYRLHTNALEFDHEPGTKGAKTVASMMYQGWDAIKNEIAKCNIRCANCHAVLTFARKSALLVERQTHLP